MYKGKAVVVSLVLSAMLLSMMPVMAQESYNRIAFACEAKGPGLVIWGAGMLPGPVPYLFGEPEYHALLETSTFALAGTAKVEWSDFELPGSLERYLFEEGTAKIGGAMRAQWTEIDGESRELTIVFKSTEETLGLFVHGWSETPPKLGNSYLLVVGNPVPPPITDIEDMDPSLATLTFRGIYRHGDLIEKISGVAYVLIFDWPDWMGNRELILNLWISELGTYVAMVWLSYEAPLSGAIGPGPEILLPARVLKVKIKLI